jgi:2-(1,2-epoxy-1,2-dihydrophenyl)acetyl-CoA isomerase
VRDEGRETRDATNGTVLLTRENGVGTLTLNRPDKLNAFDGAMGDEIVRAVTSLAADPAIRVLVITGAGRGFCAGADVDYLRQVVERRDRSAGEHIVSLGGAVATAIRETPKPVIAAVNGAAAGGGANLALACDVRIASDRASIGQVFNRIGLHPDWGGTYFLPRLVGAAKALELIYTAEMVPAAEAHRLGLFTRVVPHAELLDEARALALLLAGKPPLALGLAKRAVYESERRTLPEMLEIELRNQLTCFDSADAVEGLAAFLSKRPAHFTGR